MIYLSYRLVIFLLCVWGMILFVLILNNKKIVRYLNMYRLFTVSVATLSLSLLRTHRFIVVKMKMKN